MLRIGVLQGLSIYVVLHLLLLWSCWVLWLNSAHLTWLYKLLCPRTITLHIIVSTIASGVLTCTYYLISVHVYLAVLSIHGLWHNCRLSIFRRLFLLGHWTMVIMEGHLTAALLYNHSIFLPFLLLYTIRCLTSS